MSPSEPLRVEVDVSAAGPPGTTVVVADLFLPSGTRTTASGTAAGPTPLVACFPGGGMTRRWFDLPEELPGRWSMARALADDHGLAVLAVDHLGVGESPPPADPYALNPRVVAGVNAAVVAEVRAGLAAGSLVPGLAAVDVGPVVGLGHSMGGLMVVHQQARHRSFDGVALLGFGGAGLPEHLGPEELRHAGAYDDLERALPTLVEARFGRPLVPPATVAPGPPAAPIRGGDLLARAAGDLLALGGLCSMVPGAADEFLRQIDVPVLLVVGENDIVHGFDRLPDLLDRSPAVTAHVLPGSGHNHVVAAQRAQLFEQVGRWASALGR